MTSPQCRARVANLAAQAKIELKVEPTGAAIPPPPRAATRRSPRGKGGEAPCKPPPPATHRRDHRGKATKSRAIKAAAIKVVATKAVVKKPPVASKGASEPKPRRSGQRKPSGCKKGAPKAGRGVCFSSPAMFRYLTLSISSKELAAMYNTTFSTVIRHARIVVSGLAYTHPMLVDLGIINKAGPPKLSKPVLESMDALKWETFAAMFLAPN